MSVTSSHNTHSHFLPNTYPRTREVGTAETFALASIAPSIAVIFTNPFDTAKVRLQLQGEQIRLAREALKTTGNGSTTAAASSAAASAAASNAPAATSRVYRNSFDTMYKIFMNEGIQGLQKGLVPAIGREASKNLFRIGLYDPIIRLVHPPDASGRSTHIPAHTRFFTGAFCGAVGALSCNPFELIKTRLQSAAKSNISVGYQHNYTGVVDAARHIYRSDGIPGFYNGAGLSVLRSIFGSGSNLAAYSIMKEYLLTARGWQDSYRLDMVCGLTSGVVSCLFMNPIDVTRTRYYNQPYKNNVGLLYSSGFDAVKKILANEGPTAFYKGILAHFLRIGPHFCLTFMFLGILRRNLTNYYGYLDIRDSFSQFDRDGDGFIGNEPELREAMYRLAPIEFYATHKLADKGSVMALLEPAVDVKSAAVKNAYERDMESYVKRFSTDYLKNGKRLDRSNWDNFLTAFEKEFRR